jgi:phenylalanyl-tRNA synthetase alpha chain
MIKYSDDLSKQITLLTGRSDPSALRMKRMLAMPDLARKANSPVFYIADAVKNCSALKSGDEVIFPEIVSIAHNFDLLGADSNHPSRLPTDTFYIDDTHVLRTQTTVMWPYYLTDRSVIKRLHGEGMVLAYSYGKVYRNDEIDRHHYPVFHQIDGLCVCDKSKKQFSTDDLTEILVDITKSVFGSNVSFRVSEDTFPFTINSLQLEILWNGEWIEVLGSGLVNPKVLVLLGLEPEQYNGWAFGFGLDRLAKIKMNIPDIRILWSDDDRITRQFKSIDSTYIEVSKYPPVSRDISFIAEADLALNRFYEIVRDCGFHENEDIIEEVVFLEKFVNDSKFGIGKVSYSFRINYRSRLRTLTNDEINEVQEKVRQKVGIVLGGLLR